jgi:hypothetical protein
MAGHPLGVANHNRANTPPLCELPLVGGCCVNYRSTLRACLVKLFVPVMDMRLACDIFGCNPGLSPRPDNRCQVQTLKNGCLDVEWSCMERFSIRLTVMFTALFFIFLKLSHQPNKDAFRMPSQAKIANWQAVLMPSIFPARSLRVQSKHALRLSVKRNKILRFLLNETPRRLLPIKKQMLRFLVLTKHLTRGFQVCVCLKKAKDAGE